MFSSHIFIVFRIIIIHTFEFLWFQWMLNVKTFSILCRIWRENVIHSGHCTYLFLIILISSLCWYFKWIKIKTKFTVVGELVYRYTLLHFKLSRFYSVAVVDVQICCYFIYLTHFRTAVIAGNGTQRLVDMNLFCFDISLRTSLRFFSAARLRYNYIIVCCYFWSNGQKLEFNWTNNNCLR